MKIDLMIISFSPEVSSIEELTFFDVDAFSVSSERYEGNLQDDIVSKIHASFLIGFFSFLKDIL